VTVTSGPRNDAVRAIADPRSSVAKAFLSRLLLAADAFVIARKGLGEGGPHGGEAGPSRPRTTVIAGFPWFEDWGRDTLIAFTGLFLVTGRFEEGFRVLAGYASFVREGLVPNRFPDQAPDPDYGAADSGLWFFHAVQAYLAYTGDLGRVRDTLLGPLREIAERYAGGTRLGIGTGPDGLLHAGEPGRAVTWMDAKLGDWVVTPRRGYPVELNALWYNALRFLAELEERLSGGGRASGRWAKLAARVKTAFGARFWSPTRGHLYDVLGQAGSGGTGGRGTAGGDASSEETADASLRPNQILAVALPHPVLDRAHWRPVVRACLEDLYTPYGLRTLAPSDSAYRGLYRGGPAERDGAYHQGTVWPWLLGPFITALRRADGRSPASRLVAARMILPFEHHLREAGLGHVSEVFDGDHPHLPGGCVAQAWSLAEILRVYVEEVLDIRPPGVG
jgi:predicted glycogen debranching enzyme